MLALFPVISNISQSTYECHCLFFVIKNFYTYTHHHVKKEILASLSFSWKVHDVYLKKLFYSLFDFFAILGNAFQYNCCH